MLGLVVMTAMVIAWGETPGAGRPQPAPATPAMDGRFVATWQCQLANQTVRNNPYDTYSYTFTMTVTADGKMAAEGKYEALTDGRFNGFRVKDGTWESQGDMFAAKGTADFDITPDMPFFFASDLKGDGAMTYQMTTADGNLLTACRK